MNRIDIDSAPPIVSLTAFVSELLGISPILSRDDQEKLLMWLIVCKFDLDRLVLIIEDVRAEIGLKKKKLTFTNLDREVRKALNIK